MARDPHPSTDMAGYLSHLKARMLMPYPAVYNALGRDASSITVETGLRGSEGYLAIRAENTLVVIIVYPDGQHSVGGHIGTVRVASKMFAYEPEVPGFHRGVQGRLVNYIEDCTPRTVVYKVVSDLRPVAGGVEMFASVSELLAKYPSNGTTENSRSVRKDLQGQPILRGLVGPIWDGLHAGVATIRYESQQVYDHLSR